MDQESPQTNEVLMETIIVKLDHHDEKIQTQDQNIGALQEIVKNTYDPRRALEEIKTGIQGISTSVKSQQFPTRQIERLSTQLETAMIFFKHPIETRTQHHHHFTGIIWATAGLFLILCLVCTGWYMTADSLKAYKANDTKFRNLKLTAPVSLLQHLWQLDSDYLRDPDKMRSYVTEQERLRQQKQELAEQMEAVNRQIADSSTEAHPKKRPTP